MKSESVLAYLDNITLGDDAEIILRNFLQLEEAALRIGLRITRDKCEVIGYTDTSRSLFATNNVVLPDHHLSCCCELHCQLATS